MLCALSRSISRLPTIKARARIMKTHPMAGMSTSLN